MSDIEDFADSLGFAETMAEQEQPLKVSYSTEELLRGDDYEYDFLDEVYKEELPF